jgi:mannose-6-phosphate isomerase-like protein (cupin superfamily)
VQRLSAKASAGVRISPEENERQALSFRRERLTEGVQVAHVAVRQGENSLSHHHSRTRDTFYVMSGQLTVTVHVGAVPRPYHVIASRQPMETCDGAGRPVHRVFLGAGEVLVVEPSVVHCAANLHEEVCRFLCIEGVGEYDFIQEGDV